MGLDGKTIKGFKQGVTCCDHTLKAITWLLCRERGDSYEQVQGDQPRDQGREEGSGKYREKGGFDF